MSNEELSAAIQAAWVLTQKTSPGDVLQASVAHLKTLLSAQAERAKATGAPS